MYYNYCEDSRQIIFQLYPRNLNKRRKTTLSEQIKEGRLHCWNRSKKEDHIVGTDQRRKTTLLEQIKEGRPHCCDNYIAVYIGVGAFVVTALVAVIVVATLR
jgi:hypothetical protein